MKAFLFIFLASAASAAPTFRLHLLGEPSNTDPALQKSSASSYLLQNLHRNLFIYDNEKGLAPELGTGCTRSGAGGKTVTCTLKKNLKWSDGSALTAGDFLRTYRRILDPSLKAPRADLLFSVKNATAVYRGEKKELGIQAVDDHTLKFELEEPDPDFEYNLSSPILSPRKDGGTEAVSGPYKVKSWEKGKRIVLTPNGFYQGGAPGRPDVEMLFIEEDSTALKLFDKKELDFLRRLPTVYIPRYKSKPEFHWVPVLRLDYIGFGPKLRDRASVREALALSLDYQQLQALFHSEGRPGCPGVPESWFADGKAPCLPFDAKAARKALGAEKLPPLTFLFSALGGDDHRRAAEWEQDQWKRNLGVTVRLKSLENKLYLAEMTDHPPDLFRKGVAPDRPTCLAILETFAPGNRENYLDLKDPTFQAQLEKLRTGADEKNRRLACESALRRLIELRAFIPLGRMHFSILARPEFTGWKLNEMNQLDLAGLRRR